VGTPAPFRATAAFVVALAAGACGGSKEPTAPAPPTVAPVPGAIQVTGRERLSWDQPGDAAQYSYRVYVDGQPAALAGATCTAEAGNSSCSAPLPTLTDGVRALELAAVDGNGVEGERSAVLTLQKVTARATVAASALPNAAGDGVVSTRWPLSASGAVADVVARTVRLPAQLAPLPDGRLFVAEAGGRVRIVDSERPDESGLALDANGLLDPAPAGPLAIAVDPAFAETRFAFIADVYDEDADRRRVRVVRLREVGGRLGEPATIVDAAVLVDRASRDAGTLDAGIGGPRLAFGPDGLLYIALPAGLVFDAHPAASRPLPAIARVTREGHTPATGVLPGVTASPLAFTWHPATGALVGLVASGSGLVTLRALDQAPDAAAALVPGLTRFALTDDGATRLLRADAQSVRLDLQAPGLAAFAAPHVVPDAVRLTTPVDLETLVVGMNGRLTDLVSRAGAIYAVVADAPSASAGTRASTTGVVVRLRP